MSPRVWIKRCAKLAHRFEFVVFSSLVVFALPISMLVSERIAATRARADELLETVERLEELRSVARRGDIGPSERRELDRLNERWQVLCPGTAVRFAFRYVDTNSLQLCATTMDASVAPDVEYWPVPR
jgi:hypothetical protein